MKKGIILVGPESSGTKMMGDILLNVYGCQGRVHGQPFPPTWTETPYLTRYSLPAGSEEKYFNITHAYTSYKDHGYDCTIVFMSRAWAAVAASCKKQGLKDNPDCINWGLDECLRKTKQAYVHFFKHLEKLRVRYDGNVSWVPVTYEDITSNPEIALKSLAPLIGLEYQGLDKLDNLPQNQNAKWFDGTKDPQSNPFSFKTY